MESPLPHVAPNRRDPGHTCQPVLLPIPRQSRVYELHLEAKAALGSVGLRRSVALPPGVDEDEWVAAHVLGVYLEVAQLQAVMREFCCCDVMSAGAHVQYSWVDDRNHEPQFLSAREYGRTLVAHMYDTLGDRSVVPHDGLPFPAEFRPRIRRLLKRTFRLYAHAYLSHFAAVCSFGGEACLNFCFKHFLFFVLEFDLVTRTDMAPLRSLVAEFEAAPAEEAASKKDQRMSVAGLWSADPGRGNCPCVLGMY